MVLAGDITYATDVNNLNTSYGTLLNEALVTADSATTAAVELEVNTLTETLVNGVRYEVRWWCHVSASTAATNAIVRIRDTTVAGTELGATQTHCATTTAVGFFIAGVLDFTAVASAAKTFKMSLQGNSGANLVQIRAATNRKCRMQLWRVPII